MSHWKAESIDFIFENLNISSRIEAKFKYEGIFLKKPGNVNVGKQLLNNWPR